MAPATRSQVKSPEGALGHVLSNVLIVGEDAPIRRALSAAGTVTIVDFMELSRSDISELTYGDNETRLLVADHNKLLAVQRWYRSQQSPSLDTWFELTQSTFQTYRESAMTTEMPSGNSGSYSGYLPAALSAVQGKMASATSSMSFEDLFLKNTKRGISDYKAFKDVKQWNMWS
jgi:hypothetical protein